MCLLQLDSVESPPNSNRFVAMWAVLLDGNFVLADYIVRDMEQYMSIEMINNNLGVAVESIAGARIQEFPSHLTTD